MTRGHTDAGHTLATGLRHTPLVNITPLHWLGLSYTPHHLRGLYVNTSRSLRCSHEHHAAFIVARARLMALRYVYVRTLSKDCGIDDTLTKRQHGLPRGERRQATITATQASALLVCVAIMSYVTGATHQYYPSPLKEIIAAHAGTPAMNVNADGLLDGSSPLPYHRHVVYAASAAPAALAVRLFYVIMVRFNETLSR